MFAVSLSLESLSCIAAISDDLDLINDSVFDDLDELLSLFRDVCAGGFCTTRRCNAAISGDLDLIDVSVFDDLDEFLSEYRDPRA